MNVSCGVGIRQNLSQIGETRFDAVGFEYIVLVHGTTGLQDARTCLKPRGQDGRQTMMFSATFPREMQVGTADFSHV